MTVKRVPKSHFTGSGPLVRKADTNMVVNQPLEVEDEFRGLYESSGPANNGIIEPPFNPLTLIALSIRNNILQQCIHAMEVNIDGTGHTIELISEEFTEDESEKERLEHFFKEPYPGMSMITIRRKLRVDLEQTGNAYLEVLRNPLGEVLMLRYIPAQTVRLLRLDDPHTVEKELDRDAGTTKVKLSVRERRFVQRVGQKKVHYKEFGSVRNLDRETGVWMEGKKKVDASKLASELLWFGVDRDSSTPYYIPRWINNLPSVLGSRKAEEFNLDFFDAGGLPPAVVFISGGSLTTTVREQLQNHMNGKAKNKHRAVVVEVQSAAGTLDAQGGKVDVKVERFGSEQQKDSMFQSYDTRCEEHVRVAFRLPPLFLGKAADYNFATAVTAYMVAEEQVFKPERVEFDEIINSTILKALKAKNYKFVSKSITLKNADVMMKSIEMGADVIDGEERIKQLNHVSGMNIAFSKDAEQRKIDAADPVKQAEAMVAMSKAKQSTAEPDKPEPKVGSPSRGGPVQKGDDYLMDLVDRWSAAIGLIPSSMTRVAKNDALREVHELDLESKKLFNRMVAARSFVSFSSDPEGLAELAGGCIGMLNTGE